MCPAFNEVANIGPFYAEVERVLRGARQRFEVVFVNDGSTDGTLTAARTLRARHPNITIVDLSRNYGKEIAMTAGLDHARGDAVVIMDADLQHPATRIPAMLDGWRAGYDVVYGVRSDRDGEGWWHRHIVHAFYALLHRVGDVNVPENAGDFRLLSRKAVDAVTSLREHHRFMKGAFAWVGFPSLAIPFDVAPRASGASTFSFWKLWNFSLEGLTAHTLAPLKVSSYLGFAVAALAFGYGAFIVGRTTLRGDPVPGFPTLAALVLFLGGVQLMVLGIMGEYLGRVFDETKQRPLYFTNTVDIAEPTPVSRLPHAATRIARRQLEAGPGLRTR